MAPPEELWRMQLPNGRVACCILVPDRSQYCLMWYLGGDILGFEQFGTSIRRGRQAGNCWVNMRLDSAVLGN